MLRKLLLSVVGAFWAQKSITCVATALIFSATFQVLHTAYWPFKSQGCNQLQQICLSVLNIVYIAGLLLKTKSLETGDQEDLGILLVLLLIVATLAVVLGIVLEIRDLLRLVTRTRRLAFVLRRLPQQDPPDDISEFYNMQIPVSMSNTGTAFDLVLTTTANWLRQSQPPRSHFCTPWAHRPGSCLMLRRLVSSLRDSRCRQMYFRLYKALKR